MRALLLNPPGPGGRPYVREGRCEQRLAAYAYRMLPVSLPSTAALLRERGHAVEILDACGPRVDAGSLEGRVRDLDPDLVVVNVSTPTYDADVATIEALSRVTTAHLTAIGVHVTALPEDTLRESKLGSVVRGEPEWTVADLADHLEVASRGRDAAGGRAHHGFRHEGRDVARPGGLECGLQLGGQPRDVIGLALVIAAEAVGEGR